MDILKERSKFQESRRIDESVLLAFYGVDGYDVYNCSLPFCWNYFYRGTKVDDLCYFTTGPDYMKDIRLVELGDGRIGVFSRPRNEEILKKHGSESMIGFSIINSLDELTADIIENAPLIDSLFEDGEWGGCNQAY